MKRARVFSGADRLETVGGILAGKRLGLMTNPTGVNRQLESTIDVLRRRYRLTALFAVEHGIRGDAQAGDEIGGATDEKTGVPVYSAYGAFSHFSDEMLNAFDVLVFDIQDVGLRFYTYLYSLAYAMESCDRAGKPVVVLDRINPLGGLKYGGTALDLRFRSFVGDYELPTQYRLTIGEFALYAKDYLRLTLPLTVVKLEGWDRRMLLDDTDLPWVAPSPNCPTLDTALCYAGNCVFEGTNVSEGRGTTLPFQVVGAPYIDGGALEAEMNALSLPGVRFRQTSFRPTFSKYEKELCRGVQTHVLDRDAYDGFTCGLLLLHTIRRMYPERFSFLRWEKDGSYTVDKILGTDAYRTGKMSAAKLIEASREPVEKWMQRTRRYLLY